jgi:uncharacterized membrane protein
VTRLRLLRLSGTLLAIASAFVLNGCSKQEDCIYFSVRFHGIGHLGTVSPDSSIALGVSTDGTEVVGTAAEQHMFGTKKFGPGTTGVLWAELNQKLAFCLPPGNLGAGLQRLPLCDDASLLDPVQGTAYGMSDLGTVAVGSVTCGGVEFPATWECNGMTRLPLPGPTLSGAARSRNAGSKELSATAGYLDRSIDPADSSIAATVWTDDLLSPPKPVGLVAPGGLSSSDAYCVISRSLGPSAVVAGIGYDEALGRSASSVPAAWRFLKGFGLGWRGTWPAIDLQDDTGGPAKGAAKAIAGDGPVFFGHIMKSSGAQGCMWPATGLPSSIKAVLLGSPPGISDSYINAVGHDGTMAVGYGLSSAGPKAIAYFGGTSVIIKDQINSIFPGTIPADWELQEATAISQSADDMVTKATLANLSWAVVGRGTHAGVPEGWVLRFQRAKVPWWQCLLPDVKIFKDPHIYKWPPKFPPENPAFRAAVPRSLSTQSVRGR